jgi:hypothetical protein
MKSPTPAVSPGWPTTRKRYDMDKDTNTRTDEPAVGCTDLLVPFENIPLGGRFRYPGMDSVWTVLSKYRKEDGKRLFGTIAEWKPGMMTAGNWTGQSICAHLPDDQGGDCPEFVYPVD